MIEKVRQLSNLLKQVECLLVANNGSYPERPVLTWSDDKEHIDLKSDLWAMSLWKEEEASIRPTHCIDDLEKLENELYSDLINNKQTTPRPQKLELSYNIITNIGLTESAKRDTGETSTTLTHNSIGTSSTTPVVTDTDLISEDSGGSYARQAYASAGQRKVVNQTGKYSMVWNDSVISAAGLAIKESGINWHLSDSNKLHARVTFTTFTLDSGLIFATQLNELHENGA